MSNKKFNVPQHTVCTKHWIELNADQQSLSIIHYQFSIIFTLPTSKRPSG